MTSPNKWHGIVFETKMVYLIVFVFAAVAALSSTGLLLSIPIATHSSIFTKTSTPTTFNGFRPGMPRVWQLGAKRQAEQKGAQPKPTRTQTSAAFKASKLRF